MNKSSRSKSGQLQASRLRPNHEPLYKRLPTHDEDGNFISDFMMLIPGLKHLPGSHLKGVMRRLENILGNHRDVVFVDLNAPLNLLWVSVKAREGVIQHLSSEIRRQIPEAKLVGHPMFVDSTPRRTSRLRASLRKLLPGRG